MFLTSLVFWGCNLYKHQGGTWSVYLHSKEGVLAVHAKYKHDSCWYWIKVGSLFVKLHTWCMFLLPATVEQLNNQIQSMASISIFQMYFWMCCLVPRYLAWNLLVSAFRIQKGNHFSSVCNFKPSDLICSLHTSCLNNAASPSTSPFLWPVAKKFHVIW